VTEYQPGGLIIPPSELQDVFRRLAATVERVNAAYSAYADSMNQRGVRAERGDPCGDPPL
jgi:hypothetical protein